MFSLRNLFTITQRRELNTQNRTHQYNGLNELKQFKHKDY